MSQNQNTPTPEATDTEPRKAKPAGLTSDAMARRRMLVKSLGKGSSVIAAAAIPMHTLAAPVTASGNRCSISGTMSGVHSQDIGMPVCSGFSQSYYSTLANWPNYDPSGGGLATNSTGTKTFTNKSKFSDVFGGSSAQGNTKIFALMSTTYDEAHWVTALLNSVNSKASNFPYTPAEVIAFYNSNSSTQYTNALNFFKNFMETHTS